MKEARTFHCHRCDQEVQICGDCDHGNIYCLECAPLARTESKRVANRRYQSTHQGKRKHAERAKKYRARQKQNDSEDEKVTDHPLTGESLMPSYRASMPVEVECVKDLAEMNVPHCHFCGCEVLLTSTMEAYYPTSP